MQAKPQQVPQDSKDLPRPAQSSAKVGTETNRDQAIGDRCACYRCGSRGHLARQCPKQAHRFEAPGRSSNHPTSRRLCRERQLIEDDSVKTRVVTTSDSQAGVVGPTLLLDLQIEGVPVEALVDTGSQSTIISRTTLHTIAKHLRENGHPLPKLEEPTVKLFGKDGQNGGRELVITAQLNVTLEADGRSVSAPVFVQPDSEQPCLLGMNAAPLLGLSFLRANGKPLCADSEVRAEGARIRLLHAVTIRAVRVNLLRLKWTVTFNKDSPDSSP